MIVVFGSLNLDLVFPVRTLPRPGETVLTPGLHRVPGGKGANQALAARRAVPSMPVAFVGAAGATTGPRKRQRCSPPRVSTWRISNASMRRPAAPR